MGGHLETQIPPTQAFHLGTGTGNPVLAVRHTPTSAHASTHAPARHSSATGKPPTMNVGHSAEPHSRANGGSSERRQISPGTLRHTSGASQSPGPVHAS